MQYRILSIKLALYRVMSVTVVLLCIGKYLIFYEECLRL